MRHTRNMWAEDDVLDAEAEATAANLRWFGSVRDPDRRLSSSVEKAAAQEATGAKFAHLHAGASRFDPPARRASRELLAKPLSPRSPGAAREHVYDLSLTGVASLGRRDDPTIVLVRQYRLIFEGLPKTGQETNREIRSIPCCSLHSLDSLARIVNFLPPAHCAALLPRWRRR